MLTMIGNLFRKNKRFIFHPRYTASGTGVAVADFCEFKSVLEKASGRPVRMVSPKNILGYSYVIYEVISDEKQGR